jgi:hypothetical protein
MWKMKRDAATGSFAPGIMANRKLLDGICMVTVREKQWGVLASLWSPHCEKFPGR